MTAALPSLGQWSSLLPAAQPLELKKMRRCLTLSSALLPIALWVPRFSVQNWSWRCHARRRFICSRVWKDVTFLASSTESGTRSFCRVLWGRNEGAVPGVVR